MFSIYCRSGQRYKGCVQSPDGRFHAKDKQDVLALLKHIGVIQVTGRDEILITSEQFSGCILLTDDVIA